MTSKKEIKMKKYLALIFAVLLALSLCSCASKDFKNDVKVSYLTEKIKAALPLTNGYSEHDGDYLIYRFKDIEEHIDGYSIIYSTDTRRADLVAVFHAKSANDAKEAKEICEDFIEDQKALFSTLVEQYLPSEKDKLDGAEVRSFGNYLVVCVLNSSDKNTAFSAVENELLK